MPLLQFVSNIWSHIQAGLFPWLDEEVGPLTAGHKRVIAVLEMARVEAFVRTTWRGPGRPPADRQALARDFTAKMASVHYWDTDIRDLGQIRNFGCQLR
ncbi:MAG: hypothetical protein ACREC6_03375 [Hyphomicrobiaceae bacterium]